MNENATAGAPRTIDRRTVVKGAAWSVPAIAAAVAMPLASASGNPPACDVDCVKAGFPLVGGIVSGAWTAQGVAVVNNKASVLIGLALGLDATSCAINWKSIFQPAFTFVTTTARLYTTSHEYKKTGPGALDYGYVDTDHVYTQNLGAAIGAGNINTVGAMPTVGVFNDVYFPSELKVFGVGFGGETRFNRLEVDVKLNLQYGLGGTLHDRSCDVTLRWDLHGLSTGAVIAGLGTVNITGTATV